MCTFAYLLIADKQYENTEGKLSRTTKECELGNVDLKKNLKES